MYVTSLSGGGTLYSHHIYIDTLDQFPNHHSIVLILLFLYLFQAFIRGIW